jgi:hypothetical protein
MDRLRRSGDEAVARIRSGIAEVEDIPRFIKGDPIPAVRALQVLEAMGIPEAAILLGDLAGDEGRPRLAAAAASSLARLRAGEPR